MLYTGKAAASFLAGPVASQLSSVASWRTIILGLAAASLLDAFLALVVLKGLLRRSSSCSEAAARATCYQPLRDESV